MELVDVAYKMQKAGVSAEEAWGAAAIGMAKATANFIGDVAGSEGVRAVLMAMISTADAARSFTLKQYAEGAMHVATAALYTAAAAQAFSVEGAKKRGSGGRSTARRPSRGGVPGMGASLGGGGGGAEPGTTLIVNYNGTTFVDRERFDRQVRRATSRGALNTNTAEPVSFA